MKIVGDENMVAESSLEELAMIIWSLWISWNALVFEGKTCTMEDTLNEPSHTYRISWDRQKLIADKTQKEMKKG